MRNAAETPTLAAGGGGGGHWDGPGQREEGEVVEGVEERDRVAREVEVCGRRAVVARGERMVRLRAIAADLSLASGVVWQGL